jgi:hypothetical protein
MVAIIVTMILMFVITLIVLGFSESTRRNQREALDTQLGQQAYYAAETGVNDITSLIKSGTPLTNTSTCTTPWSLNGQPLPRVLKANPADPAKPFVANTCLMVESQPSSLVVDSITATSGSVVWHVKNAAGVPFTSLKLGWSPDSSLTSPANTCPNAFQSYPSAGAWNCDRALLRVDILPAALASTDADALGKVTTTLYMQPDGGNQQDITISAFGNPAAKQGACAVTGPTPAGCSVTVNVAAAGVTAVEYYVRLTALYVDAKNVTLSGADGLGTSRFTGGQIVVDSTGRAQDQIKRIKVRIPLTTSSSSIPVFGVQSAGSTCKDIIFNGGFNNQGICNSFLVTP